MGFRNAIHVLSLLLLIQTFSICQDPSLNKIDFEYESEVHSNCINARGHYSDQYAPRFLYCYEECLGCGNPNLVFDLKEKRFLKKEYQARITREISVDSGYIRMFKNNKWGIVDFEGRIMLPFEYDTISYYQSFSDKKVDFLAYVCKNNKYGFIDENIDFLVEPKFDSVNIHYQGLVTVKMNEKYGVLDKNANETIPIMYDSISYPMTGGNFIVYQNSKTGVVNKENNQLIPIEYDYIYDCAYSKLFLAKKKNKFTLLNLENQTLTKSYSELKYLGPTKKYGSDHIFSYKNNIGSGLLDQEGPITQEISDSLIKKVKNLDNEYYSLYYFTKNEKKGIVDENGSILIPPNYDNIESFAERKFPSELVNKFIYNPHFKNNYALRIVSENDYSYKNLSFNFLTLMRDGDSVILNVQYDKNGGFSFIPLKNKIPYTNEIVRVNTSTMTYKIDTIIPFGKKECKISYNNNSHFILRYDNDDSMPELIDASGNVTVLEFDNCYPISLGKDKGHPDLISCYKGIGRKGAFYSISKKKTITPFYSYIKYLNEEIYFAGDDSDCGHVYTFDHKRLTNKKISSYKVVVDSKQLNGFKIRKGKYFYRSIGDSIPAPMYLDRINSTFPSDVTWVAKDVKMGLGKGDSIFIEPKYDVINTWMDSIYLCRNFDEGIYIFDSNGQLAFDEPFDHISTELDKLKVKRNFMFNVLDKDLNYIFPDWYRSIDLASGSHYWNYKSGNPILYILRNGGQKIFLLKTLADEKYFDNIIGSVRLLTDSVYSIKEYGGVEKLYSMKDQIIFSPKEKNLLFYRTGTDIIQVERKLELREESVGILDNTGRWLEHENKGLGRFDSGGRGYVIWRSTDHYDIYGNNGKKLLVLPKTNKIGFIDLDILGSLLIIRKDDGTYSLQDKAGAILIPPQKYCIEPKGNNFFELRKCGWPGPKCILKVTKRK